jgi:alcohol dehydrogenase class IV
MKMNKTGYEVLRQTMEAIVIASADKSTRKIASECMELVRASERDAVRLDAIGDRFVAANAAALSASHIE